MVEIVPYRMVWATEPKRRRLANTLSDPGDYPDVKDPAVDLIYLAAEKWTTAVRWQPGPSDA